MRIIGSVSIDIGAALQKRGINADGSGPLQAFIDSEVMRVSEPYMPKETGTLINSMYAFTVIGSGEIVVNTPYAHYLYNGIVYGPNRPKLDENGILVGWWSPPKKYATPRQLKYSTAKNPQAGARWFDRAMADHKDEIAKGAEAYANGLAAGSAE